MNDFASVLQQQKNAIGSCPNILALRGNRRTRYCGGQRIQYWGVRALFLTVSSLSLRNHSDRGAVKPDVVPDLLKLASDIDERHRGYGYCDLTC